MAESITKLERWRKIEMLLASNPEGIKVSKLSHILEVNRTTVYRDVDEMGCFGIPIFLDEGKKRGLVMLQIKDYLTLRLNKYEAISMFIAIRLLARQNTERNPHVESLLIKLARNCTPTIYRYIIENVNRMMQQPENGKYIKTFEQLTDAWVYSKRIKIWYKSVQSSVARERLFDVYFIEPLETVFSCYVIGFDHSHNELRTLKIKRIEKIEFTDEIFSIPTDIDIMARWVNSWGIIASPDSVPINIKLRFSSNVVHMVKETLWHPSQRIEDTNNGGCIFYANADHRFGVKLWIRTWGPDVEVLEPENLRKELAFEALKTHTLYDNVDLNDVNSYDYYPL